MENAQVFCTKYRLQHVSIMESKFGGKDNLFCDSD